MIILDTNVLSEVAKPVPSTAVVDWLDRLDARELATTATTVGELHYGIARLPMGRRRSALAQVVRTLIKEDLAGRVLPFDEAAAEEYAAVATDRERRGRPIHTADAQIAAICRVRDATLATRNIKDFEMTGAALIDPWAQR